VVVAGRGVAQPKPVVVVVVVVVVAVAVADRVCMMAVAVATAASSITTTAAAATSQQGLCQRPPWATTAGAAQVVAPRGTCSACWTGIIGAIGGEEGCLAVCCCCC
jgi:hypothetical protein